MTGRNDWYDSEPGYIYRLSSHDLKIESTSLDTIDLALIKGEVVCELSRSNGVRTWMTVR